LSQNLQNFFLEPQWSCGMGGFDFNDAVAVWKKGGYYPFFPVIESASERIVTVRGRGELINFSSCDYLGLSNDNRLKAAAVAAIERFGTNVSASIAISGQTAVHANLEAALSSLFDNRPAMLFTTSYLANLGVLGTMADETSTVYSDRANHASLIDGIVLSRARLRTYRHNDVDMLSSLLQRDKDAARKIVVTDGLFSADGDFCRLKDLVTLAEQHDAMLILDSAHDLGAFGPTGRGLAEAQGLLDRVDLIVGTMSKAFGSTGGFVIGREESITRLKHRSAPFHSSRTFSPGVAAASLEALRVVRSEGHARRAALMENAETLRGMLRDNDFDTLNTESYVVPVIYPDTETTLRTAHWLQENGILVAPFIFPSVPRGKERLRLGVTSTHTKDDLHVVMNGLLKARRTIA
jgi:8-amino-7-oxononanoate synthase